MKIQLNLTKKQVLTWANLLTTIRIILAIPITYNLILGNYMTVLLLFILALFTDLFDGIVARAFNQISELGQLLDGLADKIITLPVFIIFTYQGFINWQYLVFGVILSQLTTFIVCPMMYKKHHIPSEKIPIPKSLSLGKATMWGYGLVLIIAFLSTQLEIWNKFWIIQIISGLLAWGATIQYIIQHKNITNNIKGDK